MLDRPLDCQNDWKDCKLHGSKIVKIGLLFTHLIEGYVDLSTYAENKSK